MSRHIVRSPGAGALIFGLGAASCAALLLLSLPARRAEQPAIPLRDAPAPLAHLSGVFGLPPAARLAPLRGARAIAGILSPAVIKKLDKIWTRYSTTSPGIKAIRAEFANDPEVRQLIEKYKADKDLPSLMKAAAASKHLRRLAESAAASPDALKMLFEFIQAIPPDSLRKAAAELGADPRMVEVLAAVARTSRPAARQD